MTIVLRNTSKAAIVVTNKDTGKKLSVGRGVTIAGEGYRHCKDEEAFSVIVDKKPDPALTLAAVKATIKQHRPVKVLRPKPDGKHLEVHQTPVSGKTISVGVPPRISDISWIHSKLVTLGRPIYYRVSKEQPSRAVPFCLNLTNVVGAEVGDFSLAELERCAINPHEPIPKGIEACMVSLTDFIMDGNRIDTAFPGVETDFHYPWKVEPKYRILADRLGRSQGDDAVLFGVCPTGWGEVRVTKGWNPLDWVITIKKWQCHFSDRRWVPVLFGMEYDKVYMDKVSAMLTRDKIPHIYAVGYDMGVVISLLLRHTKFLIGLHSGICTLANVCHIPSIVQYSEDQGKMKDAWCDPNIVYRGIDIKSVDQTFEVIQEMVSGL